LVERAPAQHAAAGHLGQGVHCRAAPLVELTRDVELAHLVRVRLGLRLRLRLRLRRRPRLRRRLRLRLRKLGLGSEGYRGRVL
jgi:hypothetical protein